MRCRICDVVLSPESTHWNSDHEEYDPCPTCLMIIAEVFDDPLDEDEITWLLEHEETFEEDQTLDDFQEESS